MGEVEDVAISDDDVGWGRCLRVRVSINLFQPLDRGRALLMSGRSCWVSFKYEKFSGFCFKCGCILHGQRGCSIPFTKKQNHDESSAAWGPWLWAEELSRGLGVTEDGRERVYSPPWAETATSGESRARVFPDKEKSQGRKDSQDGEIPLRKAKNPGRDTSHAEDQNGKEKAPKKESFDRESERRGNRKRKSSMEINVTGDRYKEFSNSIFEFDRPADE